MTIRTIAEHWENYRRKVMPVEVGAAQWLETRRAFYAGSHAMLYNLFSACALPESDASAWIDRWRQECLAFLRDVEAQRA